MAKDFRFGPGLHAARSLRKVQDAARRAEDLGFDVLHVPDHLGAPAPSPVLTAAATRTLRVGTFDSTQGSTKRRCWLTALRDLSEGRF